MKKILVAIGTRPEAIKMLPLVHMMRSYPSRFSVEICSSGQHRQMLDQVLKLFDTRTNFDLNIMKPGQTLFDITTNVLLGMEAVLLSAKPDLVLVHGDTTTAMASSMACFYSGIPVGHVEAGLRTHDLSAPFPEEFNRQVVGRVAQWHFAPTELSRSNLLREGVSDSAITVTGNTVIDSLHWILDRINKEPDRATRLINIINSALKFDWRKSKFVLITGHRRENFGDGFMHICDALRELASNYNDINFVYPLHLNPNVQKPVRSILGDLKNVHLIDPLDYEPFVYLLQYSHIVLTDSGGIQEEAPSLGKPVLVMRDLTERPEAVQAGTVILVGANRDRIVENVSELLDNDSTYERMSRAHNPYGDGKASARIIDVLKGI